ncbi:hypothetical protein EIP86_002000 [Pleurotus ostreatoroseus]|nr:hypothetical protein EIP86_002000 [Pleurotus ostreatoroseus]
MKILLPALSFLAVVGGSYATHVDPRVLDACPGYRATHISSEGTTLNATLVLAGEACNVFGNDIEQLELQVTYETASHPIIFEPQYLRVKTSLPNEANIYGLGEHTDTFRLPTFNTTRTLWSRDAYGVPTGSNLYGNHPIYFEHRTTGTHGVFLLNSNGMDVKINDTDGTSLEYNVIGGVLDFYFLAGSETDPIEVSRQYAEIVGTPAEVPYWSFGLHQCRFGYQSKTSNARAVT